MQTNYGSLRKVELRRVHNPYDEENDGEWGYVELFVEGKGDMATATMWYNLTIDGRWPTSPCTHWCNVPNNTCCKCCNITASHPAARADLDYGQTCCEVCSEAEKYETQG